MNIPLEKLNYAFTKKPIVVGGMAMEFYGLRKSGKDIDLIATEHDVIQLIKMYPDRVKNLYSDLGVCPFEFEIWRTISLMDYETLHENTIDEGDFLVISLPNLLLMKALALKIEKYLEDTKLIVEKITKDLYSDYENERLRVLTILNQFDNITFIEKSL